MSVKEEIMRYLEEHRMQYTSGQTLADALSISRNAVCKVIHVLQKEGYHIESKPRKGYRLMEDSDVLSAVAISYYLNKELPIHVYEEVDSTNQVVKKMAIEHAPHHTLVVANSQTQGRGRFGRSFYSPKNSGIYMSLLLRQTASLQDTSKITIQAAVAVYEAIRECYGIETQIKWVNDIYYQGHKLCGILCEAISDFESGQVEAIIMGIGLNVTTQDFPEKLSEIATALPLKRANRNALIAAILQQFFLLEQQPFSMVLDSYRQASLLMNKTITYPWKQEMCEGIVTAINDEGNLVVESKGEKRILQSGEVSIRFDKTI